jgi:hypothetical protein
MWDYNGSISKFALQNRKTNTFAMLGHKPTYHQKKDLENYIIEHCYKVLDRHRNWQKRYRVDDNIYLEIESALQECKDTFGDYDIVMSRRSSAHGSSNYIFSVDNDEKIFKTKEFVPWIITDEASDIEEVVQDIRSDKIWHATMAYKSREDMSQHLTKAPVHRFPNPTSCHYNDHAINVVNRFFLNVIVDLSMMYKKRDERRREVNSSNYRNRDVDYYYTENNEPLYDLLFNPHNIPLIRKVAKKDFATLLFLSKTPENDRLLKGQSKEIKKLTYAPHPTFFGAYESHLAGYGGPGTPPYTMLAPYELCCYADRNVLRLICLEETSVNFVKLTTTHLIDEINLVHLLKAAKTARLI